jgi:hypothetical protein
MKLETDFLLCENPASMPGPGLVLAFNPPHFIGKVVNFKTDEEAQSFIDKQEGDVYGFCKGYRIAVIIIDVLGQFHSSQVPLVPESAKQMANFYLENKILKNAGYYKRYKQD